MTRYTARYRSLHYTLHLRLLGIYTEILTRYTRYIIFL